jgi:molybdate transport system substrate-binding protein
MACYCPVEMTLSLIKRMARSLPCLAALILAACSTTTPAKLRIAAAADLNFALNDIARQQPNLSLSYGSSGNLFTQIRNGAPFDLFLSADADYPRQLARRPDAFFIYTIGHLVVWVPAASPLDPSTALRSSALERLAIANPQHAPYGRAAEAALRHMGLYDSLQRKFVIGENIAQAFQFAESGAANAGLVALSLARAAGDRGRYWEVPLHEYPPLEQGGVILKDSPAARAFRDYLLSDAGRRILKQYGFSIPGE